VTREPAVNQRSTLSRPPTAMCCRRSRPRGCRSRHPPVLGQILSAQARSSPTRTAPPRPTRKSTSTAAHRRCRRQGPRTCKVTLLMAGKGLPALTSCRPAARQDNESPSSPQSTPAHRTMHQPRLYAVLAAPLLAAATLTVRADDVLTTSPTTPLVSLSSRPTRPTPANSRCRRCNPVLGR
jgi:hypothetical protein